MFRPLSLLVLLILFFFKTPIITAQKIALLKYKGGGDWYANITTSLPNLIQYANQNIHTTLAEKADVVTPDSPDLFNYPFIHMTGHGNVFFDQNDIKNLRKYLLNGGFLHIDDNYGMDPYIRPQIKKLFPNQKLVELPKSHPIFNEFYHFPSGLPKIHEHNGKRPQAFAIIIKNRIVLLYTYETDLGDGWESEVIHHDPWKIREKALKMGTNILKYAFTN